LIKKFCYDTNHKNTPIETVVVECYEKDWQVKFEGSRKEFNEYLERRDMREDESIKPYAVGKSFAYHAITNNSILKTNKDNEVIINSFE
jgi:hypothetical protein